MLRSIPDVANVANILTTAIAASSGGNSTSVSSSVTMSADAASEGHNNWATAA
jgi:hypothetical protein